MAWSKSLNNKFAKIQPKEEEKKKDSGFYDDYKTRSGSNNNSVSFTPSVKAKTGGNTEKSTSLKESGGSSGGVKRTAPTTVFGNDTKYFKGFQSYQDRKKTGNVFTPSTVLGRHDNRFSKQNTENLKAKQWRGSYGVMPAPTRLTSGDTARSEKKPGFGKWLVDNMMNGIGQFNRSLASTADFILPTAGDFGGDSAVDRIIDYYKGDADRLAAKAARTNEVKGGHWGTAGDLMSSTIAAVPNAVIAMMTGGSSMGSNALGNTVSGGLGQTLFNSAQQLVKNPMFWTSFAQTAGNSYDEAKAEGASNLEATATAMISSILNAGVEIGGGIETLPNETRSIKNWVKGMMDEGKEEVIQGIVEQATRKAVYDHDKKLISTSDENAVINPKRAGQEFMGGAVVGGVLGGAQMGAGSAIDAYSDTVNEQNHKRRCTAFVSAGA